MFASLANIDVLPVSWPVNINITSAALLTGYQYLEIQTRRAVDYSF